MRCNSMDVSFEKEENLEHNYARKHWHERKSIRARRAASERATALPTRVFISFGGGTPDILQLSKY